MVLYCIVIIVCMLVFYFIPKSKGKENEDITNEEDKKARSKTQVVFKFMINMILFFIINRIVSSVCDESGTVGKSETVQ